MSGPKGARGRRFEGALDPIAAQVNASVSFDQRLLPHDVAGSIAQAQMLATQGLITDADAQAIVPPGPGSGKTRVIVERVVRLIDEGAAWPDQLALIRAQISPPRPRRSNGVSGTVGALFAGGRLNR
jgi:Argininosuccinate lyase